jgi:ketosteroid isomerase-like protein
VSAENVELVRRCYGTFNDVCNGGDLGPYIREFFAPEIVFESGGTEGFSIEGTPRGHDGIKRFYESWLDVMEDVRVEPVEIIDADDRVIVPVRLTGRMRHTGMRTPTGTAFVHALTLRRGKIVRLQMYRDRAEALAEAGVATAAPEPTAAIVTRTERIYAAYNLRYWDALFAEVDPDWEWDVAEEIEPLRGRTAVTEYFERWLGPWEEFHVEPEDIEVRPVGDRVFIAVRCWGRNRGGEAVIEDRFFHVVELSQGRWTRGKEYTDRGEALAAFHKD